MELVGPWATEDMLERFDDKLTFDAYRITASAKMISGENDEAKKAIEVLKEHYPHTRALESLPYLQ